MAQEQDHKEQQEQQQLLSTSVLAKINFGNDAFQFDGYFNCPNVFLDGVDVGATGLNKPLVEKAEGDVNTARIASDSICAAKFMYSLEYMGCEHDPQRNLFSLMRELYRICCDGALIEVKVANAALSAIRHNDPLWQRSIDEDTWYYFNAELRAQLAADERYGLVVSALDQSGINFKVLRSSLHFTPAFVQRMQAGEFKTQQELFVALQREPQAVIAKTYYLVCIKDKSHTFALVNFSPLAPFIMRVFDPKSSSVYIARSILQIGAWEPNETRIVTSILQSMLRCERLAGGFKIANIGANIGWYTVIMALLSDKLKVDAFEPTPATQELLSQNMRINAVDSRVTVYPVALSNENTRCELFTSDIDPGCNSLQLNEASQNFDKARSITVETKTLDSIYLGLDRKEWPEFMVIDTEGHEQLVFNGAKGMLEQGWRPAVMTEFAPQMLAMRGECTYYIDLLEKYDYSAYVITRTQANHVLTKCDLSYLKQQFERLASPENKNDAYMDLLFLPAGFKQTSTGFVVE